jgi:hypothetical protein
MIDKSQDLKSPPEEIEFGATRECRVEGVSVEDDGAVLMIAQCEEGGVHALIFADIPQFKWAKKAKRGMIGVLEFQQRDKKGSWNLIALEGLMD